MAPAIVVGVGGACFAYYFGTRGQNRQIKNISFILHPRIISRCMSEKFNQKHFVVYVPNKSTETQCSIVQKKGQVQEVIYRMRNASLRIA